MIISASRRTDIPTYYTKWFFNRIKEGYVYVRNPINIYQVSKVSLSPDVVDAIVFWTKNPKPMMKHLDKLKNYKYYFQFSLTSYGKEVESNVPSKDRTIINTFRELSEQIGKEKVIWRYDPIFFSDKYTIDYHIKYFEKLADKLYRHTEKCTISIIDDYAKTKRNTKSLNIKTPTIEEQYILMEKISKIARERNLLLDTCAETTDFSKFGVKHAHCIDKELLERICGKKLDVKKDTTQREACGCVDSIDIGMYNTCKNGCLYCYANFNKEMVVENFEEHNPNSPLLVGEVCEKDRITERKVKSILVDQLDLF